MFLDLDSGQTPIFQLQLHKLELLQLRVKLWKCGTQINFGVPTFMAAQVNFRDLPEAERVVQVSEVDALCSRLRTLRAEQGGGSVHCFEASLNNCFGLKARPTAVVVMRASSTRRWRISSLFSLAVVR